MSSQTLDCYWCMHVQIMIEGSIYVPKKCHTCNIIPAPTNNKQKHKCKEIESNIIRVQFTSIYKHPTNYVAKREL